MVDVSHKTPTARTAVAMAQVQLSAAAFQQVMANQAAKGDVLTIAQVAGVMAAKNTANLIPLCHSLPLSSAHVRIVPDSTAPNVLAVLTCARTRHTTGVEMEAMMAASIAALTIYDMTKAVSKDHEILQVRLLYKTGGKSGAYLVEPLLSKYQHAIPPDWLS